MPWAEPSGCALVAAAARSSRIARTSGRTRIRRGMLPVRERGVRDRGRVRRGRRRIGPLGDRWAAVPEGGRRWGLCPLEDRLRPHGSPPDHGLGLRSDRPDRLRFVEGAVAEHGEGDVRPSSGEAEQGLCVVLSLDDLLVIVGPRCGGTSRPTSTTGSRTPWPRTSGTTATPPPARKPRPPHPVGPRARRAAHRTRPPGPRRRRRPAGDRGPARHHRTRSRRCALRVPWSAAPAGLTRLSDPRPTSGHLIGARA